MLPRSLFRPQPCIKRTLTANQSFPLKFKSILDCQNPLDFYSVWKSARSLFLFLTNFPKPFLRQLTRCNLKYLSTCSQILSPSTLILYFLPVITFVLFLFFPEGHIFCFSCFQQVSLALSCTKLRHIINFPSS